MKKSRIIFTIIVFTLVLSNVVYADIGPKPSIEIIVKNPPEVEYYLDLLVDYEGESLYPNIREEDKYSADIYNILKNYNLDGWRPAMVTGTKVPIFGDIIGEKDGENMVHSFSYIGVPDRFKIIIVTSDGETIVSENIIERKAFKSKVYFDYNTKKLKETSIVLAYIMQFLATYPATLLIESLILILFGFSLKKNWKSFVLINLITQILLTFIIFGAMYKQGSMAAIFFYIPFEIIILIIEAKLFKKYLLEHSESRRVAFAIVANIVSFLIGAAAMIFLPELYF
ncbi:MAG: hypothetical protein GX968_00350 [Tissierellia bacterium]|nr:hypothetical protein [Tissierellia bacterium]